MKLEETLEFIHGIPRFNKVLGLEKIRTLLEKMGNPQDSLQFVHIAGTNGKGSTSTMLSYILKEAGYKTGLYISPYVLEFRERIQINNQMIPYEDLIEITQYVRNFWLEMKQVGEPPSEFEVVLAVALEYFKRSACQIVVLEVGMGGQWDATNVIESPLVTAITSISLDHIAYLGDRLEDIAKEKAGIIKKNGITVTYPHQEPEVLGVLMERCAEEHNRLLIPHRAEVLSMDLTGSTIIYGEDRYTIPLMGEHQIFNTLTVLEICGALSTRGIRLTQEQIAKGLKKTKFPCRLEILSRHPLVILDGAHNQSGAEALAKSLILLEGRPIHGVLGVLKDKDARGIIRTVVPHLTSVVATAEEHNSKFVPPMNLADELKAFCHRVSVQENPLQALKEALSHADAGDAILICGSLYLASALRGPALELLERVD